MGSDLKSVGKDALPLSMPKTGVFIEMATSCYASVIYYFLLVASQRINEAKYFIISHIACRYTSITNKVALVLQLYYSCHVCLNMNDLAQLEC